MSVVDVNASSTALSDPPPPPPISAPEGDEGEDDCDEDEDEAAADKFKPAEFEGLPKNIIFGIDKGGAIRKQIAANMNLSHPNLSPIFFISDTFNRVVYLSQGYTIGLGEQMELVIKKL